MDLAYATLGIMDPLYTAFGWFMRLLYDLVGNYGVVIIIFTLFIRLLMFPMGLNQQKNTFKQQALQGEIAEIRRLYPDDKEMQSKLQMELYKKHGASPLAGCLPAILQLIIIWPIFRIIQAPLRHIMNVPEDNLTQIGEFLHGLTNSAGEPLIAEAAVGRAATMNIPLINALNDNGAALAQVVNRGLLKLSDMLDVEFLGMNLGLTPTWKPALLFADDTWRSYVPLLVFPVLVLITTLIQMRITRLTMPNRKKKAEDKAREQVNPARAGQTPEDKSESMMKSMNVLMPIFMLWTTFSLPAAMGLYWIVGNIMMILQSVVIYFIFTKKMEALSATDSRKTAKNVEAAGA
ncbi:MAG: YidC/Oxa1 family membrane protein insertase [Clostridia bacterium]|nr:YidC/Oxa1 family membrane protein insertase [Eubacteriales bacterium]NCC47588.1 YidC/Oxa1 family membrane protein insertase [Clostridia bacterium]